MHASRWISLLLLIADGVVILSCGSDTTGPGGTVASIKISPDTDSVVIGKTITLQATAYDANGHALSGEKIFWSTQDEKIAAISDQGVVTGVAAGTVQIAASVPPGTSGIAQVTVLPKPVASVTVSPSSITLKIGQTVHLSATTYDADGNQLTGRSVSWSSQNTAVATVDQSGMVTAAGAGSTTITATSEGKQGQASVTVQAPPAASIEVSPSGVIVRIGQTAQLTATVKDASGAVIPGAPVTWTSSNENIATVSANNPPTTATVTGVGVGLAIITATSGSVETSVEVGVNPIPAHSVIVSPNSATLTVGDTETFSAEVTDSTGAPLTGRPISWNSNNAQVASVGASTGLVTAVGAGSATITASSGGKQGTASVTVNPADTSSPPPPSGDVSIAPAETTITVGATAQFRAQLTSGPKKKPKFTWESSQPSIATVSDAGLVTGVAPGSATITAKSGGRRGTASVTVAETPEL